MRFRRVNLNLLVILDAILSERSITKAGQKISQSQSAVSGALAQLRHHFNDKLVVQVGRTLLLTPLAEQLQQPIREMLQQAKSVLEMSVEFDPATSRRHFSIVMSDLLTSLLMPSVLSRLTAAAPGIGIELRNVDLANVGDDLERGAVDLLITPSAFAVRGLPSEIIYRDDFSCLAWAGNEEIGDALSVEQFAAANHAVINLGRTTTQGLLGEELAFLQVDQTVALRAGSFLQLTDLIVGTPFIATVPTQFALLESRRKPLRVLPVPLPIRPFEELMQWSDALGDDLGLQWLRGVFREVAATLHPHSDPAGRWPDSSYERARAA